MASRCEAMRSQSERVCLRSGAKEAILLGFIDARAG
jgi:hypothetical protein